MEIAAPSTNTKSWRDALPIHPAAELVPMMSPDELRALGEDIKKNGLRDSTAIVVFKEEKHFRPVLLDGRNRLAAMEAVGIAIRAESVRGGGGPQVKLWYRVTDEHFWLPIKIVEVRGDHLGGNPREYVHSANILRRHLTAEGKREATAKLIKANPEKSNRQIAEQVKVDDKTVGSIRRELEGRAEIPHVKTRTDSKGRQQPSAKPKRWRDREDPYTWLMGGAPTLSAKAPKKPKPRPLKEEEMPTEEEAEESQQQDFYDQACHLVGLMDDATRQRFFAKMRRVYPQEVGAATPSNDLDPPQSLPRSAS